MSAAPPYPCPECGEPMRRTTRKSCRTGPGTWTETVWAARLDCECGKAVSCEAKTKAAAIRRTKEAARCDVQGELRENLE